MDPLEILGLLTRRDHDLIFRKMVLQKHRNGNICVSFVKTWEADFHNEKKKKIRKQQWFRFRSERANMDEELRRLGYDRKEKEQFDIRIYY